MENEALIRRAEDLAAQCEKRSSVTHTLFLTPAEQFALEKWSKTRDCKLLFHGGHSQCERKAAFFLPFYMDEDSFDACEYISCIEAKAFFGSPGHRDYMGAIMGLGIRREFLGDIWVTEDRAAVFCMPTIKTHIMDGLDKVGRYTVKTAECSLDAVQEPVRKTKSVSFTVKSLRLDAVCAGMFGISRSHAVSGIAAGEVSLNYEQCFKSDAAVKEGDIISLKGYGKGVLTAEGGQSRKGREFITVEIYK